ncbi:hypothetical protein V490_04037 [Pseudogymnoascus sp. VKM F-3557]|nr:hypothetical protein V490_04037 [Pseudogymnoascus sp. VKM F-3557]
MVPKDTFYEDRGTGRLSARCSSDAEYVRAWGSRAGRAADRNCADGEVPCGNAGPAVWAVQSRGSGAKCADRIVVFGGGVE